MKNHQNSQPQVKDAAVKENEPVTPIQRTDVQREVISTSYAGPIPHPTILKGYASIRKDLPERIFKEFEINSEHMRRQDVKALDAQIAEKQRGQWMAFIISVLLLAVVLYSLYIENYIFAGSSGLAYLVFLVIGFLSSKNVTISSSIIKQQDSNNE